MEDITYEGINRETLSSLRLSVEGETETLFLHVAQNRDIFTGLAILNQGADATAVTIEAFDRNGNRTGLRQRVIAPRSRVVGLLNSVDLLDGLTDMLGSWMIRRVGVDGAWPVVDCQQVDLAADFLGHTLEPKRTCPRLRRKGQRHGWVLYSSIAFRMQGRPFRLGPDPLRLEKRHDAILGSVVDCYSLVALKVHLPQGPAQGAAVHQLEPAAADALGHLPKLVPVHNDTEPLQSSALGMGPQVHGLIRFAASHSVSLGDLEGNAHPAVE
ncbi:MAG TPA: hypothetical protein VLV83_15335 [Acidobacteriota bacterium]|nr:hypothetical protein [Acidobacteriota bacterium]